MTPGQLRRHQEALYEFHNAYVAYLDATLGETNPSPDEHDGLRTTVTHLIPNAQAALNLVGVNPVMYPAPAFGGPVLHGLANVAFAHERPGYEHSVPQVPQQILDAARLGVAQLEARERELRRQRWNPFYWGDRLLRAVLGFPAYLLSLIFRVPMSRIDQSPWGILLRLIALAAEVLGIYFGGHAAEWW